jgi:RNA polymerase sigma-70 factor (ECF subfamily)
MTPRPPKTDAAPSQDARRGGPADSGGPTAKDPTAKDRAFAELFRAHHPRVLAYIRRRVADDETANDLAAEVFRVAWERALADRCPGPPWLFVTARNLVANAWRSAERAGRLRLRVVGEVTRDPFPLSTPSPEGDPDLCERVERGLGALPGPQREALIAHYWDGLSTRECAAVFGCSATAARMRLSRARAAFSRHYQQLEETS